MTSDLIMRKDFIERYCEENCGERKCWDSFDKCTFILSLLQQPTVDAVEVVHGEWEMCGEDLNGEVTYKCSNCGEELVTLSVFEIDWNYCPNCGAKMDGGSYNEMDSM